MSVRPGARRSRLVFPAELEAIDTREVHDIGYVSYWRGMNREEPGMRRSRHLRHSRHNVSDMVVPRG